MPEPHCVSENIFELHDDFFCLQRCAAECDVCYGITRVDGGNRFQRTGCGCFSLDERPEESCKDLDRWPKQCAQSCWRCAPCYAPLTKADFYPSTKFLKHGHGDFCDGQCGAYQGDCDFDADCRKGLVCGLNNCPQDIVNTYLNSRGRGDVHPDGPAAILDKNGKPANRLPDCCVYPEDRFQSGRHNDSPLAWSNYRDYTATDWDAYTVQHLDAPISPGSVAAGLGATAVAVVVGGFALRWLYGKYVAHRGTRKPVQRYRPEAATEAKPKRAGWGSLSDVDTNASEGRSGTPEAAAPPLLRELKQLEESRQPEKRAKGPRGAGVLQSPDTRPELPSRFPDVLAQPPPLPSAFPDLREEEVQKPPPPPFPTRYPDARSHLPPTPLGGLAPPDSARTEDRGSTFGGSTHGGSADGRSAQGDGRSMRSSGKSSSSPGRRSRREVAERVSRRDIERRETERREGEESVVVAGTRSPAHRSRTRREPAARERSPPTRRPAQTPPQFP